MSGPTCRGFRDERCSDGVDCTLCRTCRRHCDHCPDCQMYRPIACGICETCADHCLDKAPNDLAAHVGGFSEVFASTDDEGEPHPDDPPHLRELAEARRKARESRRSRS